VFGRVVIGVDGRAGGRDAIALGTFLAEPNARLTLAHACGRPWRGPAAGLTLGRAVAKSSALLEAERRAAGVHASLRSIVAGSAGSGLHDLAAEIGADLLVVGAGPRAGLRRFAPHDEVRGTLSAARSAVAVAPRGYAERAGAVARIGVAYDHSPPSDAALPLARALARDAGAQLSALHVLRAPLWTYSRPMPDALGAPLREQLTSERARLAALGGLEVDATYGVAGEELAAFSRELDLLVIGSRAYGPLRRLLFGSTAQYLARHAGCPVLVLPWRQRRPASSPAGGRRLRPLERAPHALR
jgi:nucleotide-binding universal stress UspA family protein